MHRVQRLSAPTAGRRFFLLLGGATPLRRAHPATSHQQQHRGGFRADNDTGRAKDTSIANPYKTWEHMNHKWMFMMCVGCLAGGAVAGRYAQVNEDVLNVAQFEKDVIVKEMQNVFELRPDLAPTVLRAAFVLAARRAGVHAEAIEESCAVATGMQDLAAVLNFSAIGSSCSMEDIVSLAAIEAIRFMRGPTSEIVWRWGRRDEDKPRPRIARHTEAPQEPNKGLVAAPREYRENKDPQGEILPFEVIMKAICYDFTDAEIVALMGAHSVGEFHEYVCGYGGAQHTPTRHVLDNRHFQTMLHAEKRMMRIEVPRSKANEDVRRLPSNLFVATVSSDAIKGGIEDLHDGSRKKARKHTCAFSGNELRALLGNKAYREWVELFARDYGAWATHFQSAFMKMIESHPNGKLRAYVSPSAPQGEHTEKKRDEN